MKVHLPWKNRQKELQYTLVYDGNGGRSNGDRFVHKSFYVKDRNRQMKINFLTNTGGGYPNAEFIFSRKNLKCVGYYARKRTAEGFVWYGTDHGWHRSFSSLSVKKQLIPEHASVEELYDTPDDKIYLVAQWEDEQGIRRNCGYEIFSHKLMAHALSGMDGKTYHNTLEAFEHGKQQGYKSFEVDLSYTEDERLVLCHGWTESNCKCTGVPYRPEFEHMTYEQAMQIPIHGHKIMDARQFYEVIKNEPEYTFEIDFHNIKKENEKLVAVMLEDFQHDEALLDRLLMQVYSRSMFEQMDSVCHFANYMYLIGRKTEQIDSVITYCLEKGICAVAMRKNYVTKEIVDKIHDAGLFTFCYTVKADASYAKYLLNMGIDMVCTDFVTESQMCETEELGNLPFYVWYNSDSPNVENAYSEDVHAQIKKTKKGNFEYQDSVVWENDGKRRLRKCEFINAGKRFAGWKLRMVLDGEKYWYCCDHLYHVKKDFNEEKNIMPYIFADEEILPALVVNQNAKLVMVAVWEDQM